VRVLLSDRAAVAVDGAADDLPVVIPHVSRRASLRGFSTQPCPQINP